MRLLLLCLLLYAAVNVQATVNIEKMITKYFKSKMHLTFDREWRKFRAPIEHAIELNLKETYSDEGMNVYVRRLSDPHRLADGVLINDNVVNVLFIDPHLMRLPRLTNPEVSFDLASNVLLVEASVNRMFIQAGYQLFRNISDVVYGNDKFDPMKSSPFNLQHVRSSGEVTIVAEDCKLKGLLVATLNERSVNLGQDSIKLVNCLFSVEITTPGLGSPPVIVPYFSKEHGKVLEMLLSRPIRDELVPKLQGAVFTLVNTSSLFGDFLPKFRQKQRSLFKYTTSFMSQSMRSINENTLNGDGGIGKWKDVTIKWSDKNPDGDVQDYKVVLTNMTITGLDSAYTAKNGGPYAKSGLKIGETIRFSDLQIRGSLIYNEHDGQIDDDYHLFYGEINDVICTITLDVQYPKPKIRRQHLDPKSIDKIEVFGWSNLELHAPTLPLIAPHSLISGVILNELPRMIVDRLSQSFVKSVDLANAELVEEQEDVKPENGEDGEGSGAGVGANKAENEKIVEIHGTNNEDNEKNIENKSTNDNDNEEIVTKNESNGDEGVAGNKSQDDGSDKGKSDKSVPNRQTLIKPKLKGSLQGKSKIDTTIQNMKPFLESPVQNKPLFGKNIQMTPMFEENVFGNPLFGKMGKRDVKVAGEASRSEAAAKRLLKGRKHKESRKVGVELENSRYEKRAAYRMDNGILSEDNEIRSE